MSRKIGSRKAKASAFDLWKSWEKAGVPAFVTGHEAYRLSNGKTGAQGDHSTPFRLAVVATKAVA